MLSLLNAKKGLGFLSGGFPASFLEEMDFHFYGTFSFFGTSF
jgi:hypothetical protein